MANYQKYHSIRARLFQNFFVDGLVAEWIKDHSEIKFSDCTIYMGQLLMVLSLEMALKKRRNINELDDITDSEAKIRTILRAMEQLHNSARLLFPNSTVHEGFLLRDDISGASDPRLQNQVSVVHSDFQQPERRNAEPSGDQLFGLMFGLLSVVEFVDNPQLSDEAKVWASRLFNYAKDNNFILRAPDDRAVDRGADMCWLSSLLHGLQKRITNNDLFDQCKIVIDAPILGRQKLKLNGVATFWSSNPQAISSAFGEEIEVPIINKSVQIPGFVVHILLMSLCSSEVWSQHNLENGSKQAHHLLAPMLYALYHKVQFHWPDFSGIQSVLEACPDSGPSGSNSIESGWHHDNRFTRCLSLSKPGDPGYQYNGVDWLLLHNTNVLLH